MKAVKIFNAQLRGLLQGLRTQLPDNYNVRKGLMALDALGPATTVVSDVWQSVALPVCGPQLLAQDLAYFMETDFTPVIQDLVARGVIPADLVDASGGNFSSLIEEGIRAPMRQLAPASQARCMDTLAKLTELATTLRAAQPVHPAPGMPVMPPPVVAPKAGPPLPASPEPETPRQAVSPAAKRRDADEAFSPNKRARRGEPPAAAVTADLPFVTPPPPETDKVAEDDDSDAAFPVAKRVRRTA